MSASARLLRALEAGAKVWTLFIDPRKNNGVSRAGVVIHVEHPSGTRTTTSRSVVNVLKRRGLLKTVHKEDRTEYVLR